MDVETTNGPAAGAVDVWTFDLRETIDETALCADERARSAAFRFDRDRVRFRRRRAHYRRVLASYHGASASDLTFARNAFGKPSLVGPDAVQFSASSSADVAVLAVCRCDVGVDVEAVCPNRADADIARRFFAPEETQALVGASVEDFFRCWTRKEAYVKAVGQGLTFPLESFAVELDADTPPRLRRSSLRPGDVDSFTLVDISRVAPGVVAALAVYCRRPLISYIMPNPSRQPNGVR